MAHKKAGGSAARQGGNVAGKRLGVKAFGKELVKPGQIIVRQRGRNILPGDNVKMGKDFTLFSLVKGEVHFANKSRTKMQVNVVPVKD